MRVSSRSGAAIALIVALYAFSSSQFISFSPVIAQAAPRLDYTISIADAAAHRFHLKIAVSNASGPTLEITMPAWTPGWYTIKPYAANAIKLHAHDNGRRLSMRAVTKQTYRIETGGLRAFTIEYDYLANDLSVNGAELTEKRGYFLGTNLFFYVAGHTTDVPATLRFELPAGWRIATGLKRASEPNTFTARNFDNLVDCPAVLGDFDEDTTAVDGKTIHIVIDPKGQLSAEARASLKEMVQRVISSQSRMFGGLPYEEYWVLFVGGDNVRTGGALEHENSTNLMVRRMPSDPKFMLGGVSHEHFHVWNVKRIKPAGLLPYDYSREQYIQELWFAEGLTSYYGDIHMMRAGLINADQFVQQQGGQITGLQSNEARRWISVDDASTTTWLTYTGGGPFTVNYYNKGQVLGFLLDLEIRGATGGRKSLDDVLRYMFESIYKRGRGYTDDDVEKAASEIAGRSFKDFFTRYIHGTEELDYSAALKHAGWRLDETKGDQPNSRAAVQYRIVEIENASDAQKALRRGLLGQTANN